MITIKNTIFRLAFAALVFSIQIFGQDGSLDLSYNDDGWVSTVIGPKASSSNDVGTQSDGKIIIAGNVYNGSNNDFGIARYNSNGSIDQTFGTDGITIAQIGPNMDIAVKLAIQQDDKIVVGGYAINAATNNNDFALLRLHADGKIDSAFGTNGRVFTAIGEHQDYLTNIKIQKDGKIVAVGYPQGNALTVDGIIIRYLQSGELDQSFGNGGIVITDYNGGSDAFNSIAFQKDGKILAVGYTNNKTSFRMEMFLVRYNADGSLDNSFGTNGMVTNTNPNSYAGVGYDVKVQKDGKILVIAEDSKKFEIAVFRYNTNGAIDADFGTNGIVNTKVGTSLQDTPNTLLIQDDGKYVVTAMSYINNASIATAVKYNSDGTLDLSFGENGFAYAKTNEYDFFGFSGTMQPDGKIIITGRGGIAGVNRFASVRFNNNASPLTDIKKLENQIPSSFVLHQNYPNPFNPSTTIKYEIIETGFTTLKIYDIIGNEVASLINEVKGAGNYAVNFNASGLSSGVYFYTISTKENQQTKKMLLLK
ncbi:MAG: T9SS type A sorting domain-containing protein [Bacteroidetes bacterium]|nr:T9SS type A sorting domain-containing protein [Bacteroidota bacterium]